MQITFTPMRLDQTLRVERVGDTLVLNGDVIDLSAAGEGAPLTREKLDCDWLAADVMRDEDGELHLTLILPHGADAPEQTLFPKPLTLSDDGPVDLPPYSDETPADPKPDP